ERSAATAASADGSASSGRLLRQVGLPRGSAGLGSSAFELFSAAGIECDRGHERTEHDQRCAIDILHHLVELTHRLRRSVKPLAVCGNIRPAAAIAAKPG